MTLLSKFIRFLRKDDRGNATVEFVIVFPVLIGLVAFVFMLSVDFFWTLTSQKAVERGARAAITRLPVPGALIKHGKIVTYEPFNISDPGDGAPVVTNYITGSQSGVPCQPSGFCAAIDTYSCRGGSYLNEPGNEDALCDAQRFTAIYDAVKTLAPGSVLPGDITITYTDSGLGRATESYIPLVTVTMDQSGQLLSFAWLKRIFGSTADATAPSVAASLVGEHLGN